MATKIRLQRHGRKRRPVFHIVVADSRAPRDGKYIERLGLYNPNTNPATINIDFDRSLYWLQTGAQPSDTARAILSYKGVLHKDFLLNGVKKGAHTVEQAEEKFNKWLESKENKISSKIGSLEQARAAKIAADMERETKMREALEARILAKNSPLAEEVAAEELSADVQEPMDVAGDSEAGTAEPVAESSEPAAETEGSEPETTA